MLLYMSYSFPADHLNGGGGFAGHPLWVAAYEDPAHGFADVTPEAWSNGRVPFWQYSDGTGQNPVPGIGADDGVDRDLFNGSAADLAAFTLRH
jgi:GH25 family lysozyme M1 (1,4-beta-N-acetylmuramidase)